ncbi:protein draper-like [Mercenaria mercenaria]|uniref:protein draper-like n=1 Tax=Mercenaria mercenaria TaxID=6596 RepID=UPI00234EC228|nr:protein draper-like [Mercenaria mercenaria]
MIYMYALKMNWILKTILTVWIYQRIFLEEFMVYGDGIEIAECKINCACCKDQDCGPGNILSEGTCYKGCIDGYYGVRCYQKCTYNCTKCDPVDTCTSCYDGYYPGANKDCTEKCPTGCKSCRSSKHCTECKEDFYNANGSTDCQFRSCPLHCQCEQGKCVSCEPGYYDASSECTKKCPSNCVTCSSRDTCEVCKDGNYNGHEFDNNNNVLLNNCTHGCRTNCTSCSSFDECLQCESGKYGIICKNECSAGCKSRVCLKENGKCEDCLKGKYGETCSHPCPYNCNDNKCDKESGYCLACSGNYDGNECNHCKAGFFGQSCNENCSSQCLNSTCDRATGQCDLGCKSNYSGDRCCVKNANCLNCSSNTECSNCKPGYFSEGCNKSCSPNCADTCEISEGFCASCKVDFHGLFCNLHCPKSCKAPQYNISRCEQKNGNCSYGCLSGRFGLKCSRTCYSGCIDNICMQDTGICKRGCEKPFKDPACYLTSESQKSEDKCQTVIIVMGVIIALLVVLVISLIASKIVVWKRQYTQRNSKDARVAFEHATSYANIEQKGGNEDMSTRKDHVYYNTKDGHHDSLTAGSSQQSEYEKVNSVEVSEHEYEHISSAV